ncbi:MAG TPA: antitoxin family protein [Isosphaeraceae bacterium]|nr:antitoxin family protein [Isosphaeraceae bacterium]
MTLSIDATYEDGVFVPVQRPDLADHERVRLTVEPVAPPLSPLEIIQRRGRRIKGDPQLAQEIARSPEFLLEES